MNPCDEIRPKLQLLVDGELIAEEQEHLLAHLETCRTCQRDLEEMEAFSKRIRAARSQVQAPESLRRRVESSLTQERPAGGSSDGFRVHRGGRKESLTKWWIGVAAIFFAVVASTLLVLSQRSHESDLMRTAIRAQQDLEQGRLPLDITTDSAQQVSSWFGTRVAFPFHMANAGIAADDRAKYKLVGGRLMSVNGERAALLSFRLRDEQVSMLVGPGSLPVDTRGASIHSGDVTLHPREQDGMHVVSWKNRGLSYVLVSRSSMKNTSACGDCHQDRGASVEGNRQSTELVSPSSSSYSRFLATIEAPGASE